MAKNCESTFEMVDRLYKEHGEMATKIGCGVVATFSGGNEELYFECIEAKNKVEDFAKKMHAKWQELISKNAEWAKIGPRQLAFNKVEKGTLTGQFDRKFLTVSPCPYDEVELVLREQGGKSKTKITFCKIGSKGNHTELGEWEFNENRGEQGKEQVARKEVNNAKGYFFAVILDSMSLTNKFEYTIKITGRNKKKSDEQKVGPVATVK